MVEDIAHGERRFTISAGEIGRRRAAFDRLAVATGIAATLAAGDLIVRGLPASLGAVLVIVVLFLVARAGLARTLDRFSRTEWALSPGSLRRTDPRSDVRYPLSSMRRLRTKRTKSGAIREMRVEFDDGTAIYVNAVNDVETLRSALLDGIPDAQQTEVREAVDFDAPWFYVLLGIAFGIAIALGVRFAMTWSRFDARIVYAASTAYCLGFGAFWLRTKPLSGRFGRSAAVTDRVVGIAIVGLGVLALAAVFLVG